MPAKGEFFAIDRRIWAKACALGMNPAVAYLVLGRFSSRDNCHTSASVNAIEQHTGVARSRARTAIEALVKAGIVLQTQDGTRPRYELLPFKPEDQKHPLGFRSETLTSLEQQAFELVASSHGHTLSDALLSAATRAVKKGWLDYDARALTFSVRPHPSMAGTSSPEWIWLPNALVTGAKGEKTPPIERVRQTQDPMCMRLFVDLYYGQNLQEDGGISREHIYRKYQRTKVAERGPFTIWGFHADGGTWVRWNELTECHQRGDLTPEEKTAGENKAIDFFRRMEFIEQLGLVEWFAYLCEADRPDAEIIHPLGAITPVTADSIENRLAFAAHGAGAALLAGIKHDAVPSGTWLVPLPHHMANVSVVGLSRLRYRPHTRNTSMWWAELNERGTRWIQHYEAIAQGRVSAVPAMG